MGGIKVDSEFQSLIPPLTDDEYQRLEKSILDEGVREPIITWNSTIVDGHNRYRICEKHDLDFKTTEREFDSRDAAKIWIYSNQLGRRNLEPGQKAALVIERNEAKVREAARLRTGGRPSKKPGVSRTQVITATKQPDPEPEKGRTTEILAKQAGVGEATIKRVLKVKRENPDLYDKVKSGEVPSCTAYKQVIDEKKPQKTTDGRRICSVCGKPIDEGDYYDSKKNRHKKCHIKHRSTLQYENPEISLIKNVPVFDINSLLIELEASADMLRSSWTQSIEISESMGVKLPDGFKDRFCLAVQNLFNTIEETRNEE